MKYVISKFNLKLYRGQMRMCLFFIAAAIFFEFFLGVMCRTHSFRFLTVFLFSVSAGLVMFGISSLSMSNRINKWIGFALLTVIAIVFIGEYMIRSTFMSFLDIEFIFENAGGAANDFSEMVSSAILSGLWLFLVYAIPAAGYLLLVKYKKVDTKGLSPRGVLAVILLIAVFWGFGRLTVAANDVEIITDSEYYGEMFETDAAVPRFGLLTAIRLDVEYLMFGRPDIKIDFINESTNADDQILADPDIEYPIPGTGVVTPESDSPAQNAAPPTDRNDQLTNADASSNPEHTAASDQPDATNTPEPVVYGPNAFDLDYSGIAETEKNSSVSQMAAYIASAEPSLKNQFTGIFKGKNLIFLTLEAFSPFMLSEELTPTLYKMSHESFVFTDYYQPAWGGSTSTGEWSNLTGLYPDKTTAMRTSGKLDMGYTIGNALLRQGYTSLAYHNGSYTYYDRDKTHKNLGYSEWIALGSGLKLTSQWPASDLEMFEVTMDDYINSQPFNIYYMTISGHSNYGFSYNAMAAKHKETVDNLPYSNKVKAFIACNLELEAAMTYMLDRLSEAGILENTVIVMSPDHYPYGLVENQDRDYFSELAGHSLERTFEYYESYLAIYCASIKQPVIINDPVYSLDILPTLLNLFGIDFESRMFTGRDALSNAPPLVIFPGGSYITEYGRFDARKGSFEPNEGMALPEGYEQSIAAAVKNRIAAGKNIQRLDYYKYLRSYLTPPDS